MPDLTSMSIPVGALVKDRRMPELGTGRVLEHLPGGFARILFDRQPPARELRLDDQTDITRLILVPGDRVSAVLAASDGPETRRNAEVVSVVADADPKGLRSYTVTSDGAEWTVNETGIFPLAAASQDPIALLEALEWRGAARFFARWNLHSSISRSFEDSGGVPTFLGARIRPLAHQLYAAQRVLQDRTPRFLLADEVGLGKTIEAGLVLQALLATNPALRFVVIAPGSVTRQWLCELYLRFGAIVCTHVDASRLRKLSLGGWERATLLSSPRLIVSTSALEEHADTQEEMLRRKWDLVIIDEAHQIPPGRALYSFLRRLTADPGTGVLALTATPSKRDANGLLALLSLIAPDTYDPARPGTLNRSLEQQEVVWDKLAYTVDFLNQAKAEKRALDDELVGELASLWKGVRDDDPELQRMLADLPTRREAAADEMVAYIQEFYRLDHRIIRTRRATVGAVGLSVSKRTVEVLEYETPTEEAVLANHIDACPSEDGLAPDHHVMRALYLEAATTTPAHLLSLLRRRLAVLSGTVTRGTRSADLLEALLSDPGPGDEEHLKQRVVAEAPVIRGEKQWLTSCIALAEAWALKSKPICARFREASGWIGRHLKARQRNKVLVFSREREVVEDFAKHLRQTLTERSVGTFHHGMDEKALSEAAIRFQQRDECRVLVSDELGGEGRNFQVASAIVHLDQPYSVARIEQRVGRLDRVGRDSRDPVHSVVLLGPLSAERRLLHINREVFKVYQRSIGGLEFVLPALQRSVLTATCIGERELQRAAGDIERRVEEELSRADRAFELSLDATKAQIADANERAIVLDDLEGRQDEVAVTDWAKLLEMKTHTTGDGKCLFRWIPGTLARPILEATPNAENVKEGSVNYAGTFDRSLALDDEQLHFFGPGHFLVDAIRRDAQGETDGRVAVFWRDLGPENKTRAFMVVLVRCEVLLSGPAEALRTRLLRQHWPETVPICIALEPRGVTPAHVVSDRRLRALLEKASDPSAPEKKLDRDALARCFGLKQLWAAAREGIALGLGLIRDQRRALLEEAAERLQNDFRYELGFYRGAIARNPGGSQWAHDAVAMREQVTASLLREAQRVDAVALIVGR